jgi:hypothetical protein
MNLSSTVGKTIADFCKNRFHEAAENHCAHFVSHVLGLDVGYDCKLMRGGAHPGASIRVQELFAACPQVGAFADAPNAPCLVFVTRRTNVDIGRHRMLNVPQKHVGIFDGTWIYHYSNTQDKVVAQEPQAFLARFQGTYSGPQALFYGTIPANASSPAAPAAPAEALAALATDSDASRPALEVRKEGRHYHATLGGGPSFKVGTGVKYQSGNKLRFGLKRSDTAARRFDVEAQADRIGPEIATLLGIVAAGESDGAFACINSYDRAAFTFGFFQLAAHTPDDNLILLFRKLVADHAGFRAQFPGLVLKDGRLHTTLASGTTFNLERPYPRKAGSGELNLKDFMAWCNPDDAAVDPTELDRAARLVWLAENDTAFNNIQVDVARHITMSRLREFYDVQFDLDGRSGLVCAAICDIFHQWRAQPWEVRTALRSAGRDDDRAVQALLKLGADDYPERCKALARALHRAQSTPLGKSVFDRASGLFRPASGWIA